MHSETYVRDELARERTELANERTFLSYSRTSIMLLASGISLLKIFPEQSHWVLLGYTLIPLGALTGLAGYWRFMRMKRLIARIAARNGSAGNGEGAHE